jgi:hypothetical protein
MATLVQGEHPLVSIPAQHLEGVIDGFAEAFETWL